MDFIWMKSVFRLLHISRGKGVVLTPERSQQRRRYRLNFFNFLTSKINSLTSKINLTLDK